MLCVICLMCVRVVLWVFRVTLGACVCVCVRVCVCVPDVRVCFERAFASACFINFKGSS